MATHVQSEGEDFKAAKNTPFLSSFRSCCCIVIGGDFTLPWAPTPPLYCSLMSVGSNYNSRGRQRWMIPTKKRCRYERVSQINNVWSEDAIKFVSFNEAPEGDSEMEAEMVFKRMFTARPKDRQDKQAEKEKKRQTAQKGKRINTGKCQEGRSW